MPGSQKSFSLLQRQATVSLQQGGRWSPTVCSVQMKHVKVTLQKIKLVWRLGDSGRRPCPYGEVCQGTNFRDRNLAARVLGPFKDLKC